MANRQVLMAIEPPSQLVRNCGTIPRKIWKDGKIIASCKSCSN